MQIANDPGSRREFLKAILTATAARGLLGPRSLRAAADEMFPPVRQITRGPRFHWFGYYDKLQFSPDNRFVLGNRGRLRAPLAHGRRRDRGGHDRPARERRWIPLGTSNAWCWQQGCMLQWIPGSRLEGDLERPREGPLRESHHGCENGRQAGRCPRPIYALAPNGKEAVGCDFSRVADCRPGYGYAGIRDRFFDDMAPEGSGVTHVNLETGVEKLIVSHKTLATTGEVASNHPARSITPITCSSARTEALHSPPSLDAARRRSFNAPHHGEHGWQRPAHRHPERLCVPLHLARCHAHPVTGQGLAWQQRLGRLLV